MIADPQGLLKVTIIIHRRLQELVPAQIRAAGAVEAAVHRPVHPEEGAGS